MPAFNEGVALAQTIREYRAVFPAARIIVVDNNSSDDTQSVAYSVLDPSRDLLICESRQGKGFAVKAGLSRVESDIYVMVDADATYPAEDARFLIETMIQYRADMMVGNRLSGGTYSAQNARTGHDWGNRFLTFVISRLAGQTYRDVLSGLRVMSRPFVAALDVRSTGFQLETEMNVIAAYLRAHVVELPIGYRERASDSYSKLSTVRDGFRIISFALTNWVAFAPMQPFAILATVMAIASSVFGYHVIAGFLETGWSYTTTATAAVATGLVAILAIFFGITLRILGRNDRRREIARFLEMKRQWNTRLDVEV